MVIEENITRLRAEIPGHIKIVAVSKTMPAEIEIGEVGVTNVEFASRGFRLSKRRANSE